MHYITLQFTYLSIAFPCLWYMLRNKIQYILNLGSVHLPNWWPALNSSSYVWQPGPLRRRPSSRGRRRPRPPPRFTISLLNFPQQILARLWTLQPPLWRPTPSGRLGLTFRSSCFLLTRSNPNGGSSRQKPFFAVRMLCHLRKNRTKQAAYRHPQWHQWCGGQPYGWHT